MPRPRRKAVPLPDIADYTPLVKQIGEIKPLSTYGLLTGPIQLTAYLAIANGVPITYNGRTWYSFPWLNGGWRPSTWAVGVKPVSPGEYDKRYSNWVAFTLANVSGLILYKAFRIPSAEVALAYAYVAVTLADAIAAYVGGMQITTSDLPNLEFIVNYVAYAVLGLSVAGALIQFGMYVSANYASIRAGISELLSTLSAGFALGGVV
jgi:hypothetical protein